jgi:NNP family nitrate/nitrite transporter-like MFS transporter
LSLPRTTRAGRRRKSGAKAPRFAEQFAPLKKLQVWRFSLYYFFVFGAFVALALWLPHYLIDVYGVDVRTAGMAAASFSLSASLFRAYGGHLSDRFGARSVMYWTFGFLHAVPVHAVLSADGLRHPGQGRPDRLFDQMGLWPFVATLFALGFFMSLGKAAVFKHIPVYYPNHVGAVGGLVGMIGGLGGFVLPIAFGALLDLTGIYTSCFALLFVLVAIADLDAPVDPRDGTCRPMARRWTACRNCPKCRPSTIPTAPPCRVLEDWRPEDPRSGPTRAAHRPRNLWISIPALLLAFSVWMVWSMVVAQAAADRLCLHAGATVLAGGAAGAVGRDAAHLLRLHGADLWRQAVDDAVHRLAAAAGHRHRLCGAEPGNPLLHLPGAGAAVRAWRGQLRLLHGQYRLLLPQGRKGQCAGAERGPWQPWRQRHAVPGAAGHHRRRLRRDGRRTAALSDGGELWMQNAGFIWVPFILASTIAAWLGMNDIADAKASFRPAIGDLHPHPQLADVRPLYRHLRQLHRLFGGLPAAVQDRLSGQ